MLNNNAMSLEAGIEAKESRRAIEAEEMRYDLYSFYSDVFKSYHGIRPRWAFDWSIQDLQDGLDALEAIEATPVVPTSGEGWAFVGTATEAELADCCQGFNYLAEYQPNVLDTFEVWELLYHVPGGVL